MKNDLRILLLPFQMAVCLNCITACTSPWIGSDYYARQAHITESKAHIAGEELAQRKQSMQRAHRDLIQIHSTLEGLRRHKSVEDIRLFEHFVEPYFEDHINPLLTRKSVSWHPELQRLDANLLFAKGAVLVELRDWRRLARTVTEIERRFKEMQDIPVEYPLGTQNTLGRGLNELRNSRFRL